MKIVVATAVGKSREGLYYDLFPTRWSSAGPVRSNTYYPFSLGYLSSLLKRDAPGHETRMLDGNYRGYTIARYAEALAAERPDLVILEADGLTYAEDVEMLGRAREAHPFRLVLCGPYPTAEPERALRDGADFVALGEFETGIVDLVRRGFDPATPGIFPNGRRPLLDVNDLPWPEDDDVSRRDYCRMYACEHRQLEVFATRGCPVNCNYCVVRNVVHGKGNFRTREVSDVVAEIRHLARRYPEITGIFFNDESHTASRKNALDLCDALVESGLSRELAFDCMCNYATLDRELLLALRRAGYYKVRFGIETLDVEASRQIFNSPWKRDNEKLREVLLLCREIGLKVYVTLSVGSSGATAQSDRATLRSIELLYQQGLLQEFQVSINTPMPGTPFYELVKRAGHLVDEDPSHQNGISSCVVSFPGYPREEIEAVFREFQAFREEIWKRNQERGIRYSQYDREWVAKVLEMTRSSAAYS
jgi:radical SAM superfamily enzyme YgiQ (UPF0313 family)